MKSNRITNREYERQYHTWFTKHAKQLSHCTNKKRLSWEVVYATIIEHLCKKEEPTNDNYIIMYQILYHNVKPSTEKDVVKI